MIQVFEFDRGGGMKNLSEREARMIAVKCSCAAPEKLLELLEAAELTRRRFDGPKYDILFAELDVAIAKAKLLR